MPSSLWSIAICSINRSHAILLTLYAIGVIALVYECAARLVEQMSVCGPSFVAMRRGVNALPIVQD